MTHHPGEGPLCAFTNCAEPATFGIRIMIPPKGVPILREQCIQLFVGLEACLAHAQSFDLQEFLTLNDPLFESMRKRLNADTTRAWHECVTTNHPDYLKYKDVVEKETKGANDDEAAAP